MAHRMCEDCQLNTATTTRRGDNGMGTTWIAQLCKECANIWDTNMPGHRQGCRCAMCHDESVSTATKLGMEPWEKFQGRCEDKLKNILELEHTPQFPALRFELVCEPDNDEFYKVLARRGQCYLVQTHEDPRDEDDFKVVYIVPGPKHHRCVINRLQCTRGGPKPACRDAFEDDSWNCKCPHQKGHMR